jgi:hypothetical protein
MHYKCKKNNLFYLKGEWRYLEVTAKPQVLQTTVNI